MKPIDLCRASDCCRTPQSTGSSIYLDPDHDYPWITGFIDSAAGKIRRVKTRLEFQDTLGAVRVRLGIYRDNYKVSPGLYAVGSPDDQSPVLVTANYKLTFDSLRKELQEQSLWMLVLDTKGINVWCAAGKGTFGTQELIRSINRVQLAKIISHQTIILPQLGAPGVSAHQVKQHTGFNVVYGPVRAADIPRFLSSKLKATREMRTVRFTLKDRLTVIPVEFKLSLKLLPLVFALLLIMNLVSPGEVKLGDVLTQTLYNFIPYLVAIALGTIGIAALLPYIPFRSFALKGFVLGIAWAVLVVKYNRTFLFPDSPFMAVANVLFLTSITSFLALNFTGSTTYTSLSGVQKETILSVPVMILAAVIGLGLVLSYKIMLF